MQYIKQFLYNHLFGWSEGNEKNLKDYAKINEIGRGGFGTVYKVKSKKDNQFYAAKVSSQLNAADAKSFTRELEILINVKHPTILPFEGYSLTDFSGEPNPTILTKYAENGTLRHLLYLEDKGQSPDNWSNTSKYIILYGIAKGMEFIHKSHYIHRDLKPENIFIDGSLFPLIGDFGLTKWFDSDRAISLTNCGTSAYMAPEIFNCQKYDQSVDVYSYGLIMYEVITGKKIFEKFNQFLIFKYINEGSRPPFPKNMNINEEIVNLINKCWSQDPSVRPSFEDIAAFFEREETMDIFDIEKDCFYDYLDIIKNAETSISNKSSIRQVDISDSYTQFTRQKIVENESEIKEYSIYPASKLVFLDEKCQDMVKLSQRGNSDMMIAVAESLFKGTNGFPKDIEIGVNFLKKASELNNVEASELYASLLIKGDKIPKDIIKANQLVDFLLKRKSPNAKKLWAQIEITKPNPNYKEAKRCFEYSASNGNVESMVLYAKLCLMKEEETHMALDVRKAQQYIKLAVNSGNPDAKKMIDEIIYEEQHKQQKNGPFSGLPSIKKVTISPSITSIGDYSFSGCSSLKICLIPPSVTKIGKYAFAGCSSLPQMQIPSSVTVIGDSAFAGCSSIPQLSIPSSVTSIGKYAFAGCSSLTQISILSSVASIGDYALLGCTSLTQIYIPSTIDTKYLGIDPSVKIIRI